MELADKYLKKIFFKLELLFHIINVFHMFKVVKENMTMLWEKKKMEDVRKTQVNYYRKKQSKM